MPGPETPSAELPAALHADGTPAPAARKKKGGPSAELRFVTDTSAKFRSRITLGYSEPLEHRLSTAWADTVTTGASMDLEVGSVDPRNVIKNSEKAGLGMLVPVAMGWTVALGHDPAPRRVYSGQPIYGSARLSVGVQERTAPSKTAPKDVWTSRTWAFPLNSEFKFVWAPGAYLLPILLPDASPWQQTLTPLHAFMTQTSLSLQYVLEEPRKDLQTCQRQGGASVSGGLVEASVGSIGPRCMSGFAGNVLSWARVSLSTWMGLMDHRGGKWRVMVGPNFQYSRGSSRLDDPGNLRVSTTLYSRLDLSAFVGGSSPLRSVVELKPSLIVSTKEMRKVDDVGVMVEMAVYLQNRRVGKMLDHP